MSKIVDYEFGWEGYDGNKAAAGSDVICALMQFYCRKLLKDLHVLDAGGGTGIYTKALIEHGIGRITLLDASSRMLEIAKVKLENDLAKRKVDEIVQAIMPPLPFCDESFDAVMFNLVLNHLDEPGSEHFPTCVETLKEARRTLKAGGIIVISTILQSTVANNYWPVQFLKSLHDSKLRNLPALEQFEEIFRTAGISCKQKLTILGSDLLPTYYTDPESCFSLTLKYTEATETERITALQAFKELEQRGEVQKIIKEHDKAKEAGLLTIFVCTAE